MFMDIKMMFRCGGYSKMMLGEQLFADSSYLFLCVPDPISIVVGLFPLILQFWALYVLMSTSAKDHPNTVYVSKTPTCGITQKDKHGDTVEGYAATCEAFQHHSLFDPPVGLFLIFLNVAPTLIASSYLIARLSDPLRVTMGLLILGLSILALVTAVLYVGATSSSTVDSLLNCLAVVENHG